VTEPRQPAPAYSRHHLSPSLGVRNQEEVTRQPWEDLVEAESAYRDRCAQLYAAGVMTEQPRLALADVAGRDIAPRLAVLVAHRLDDPEPQYPDDDYRRVADLLDLLGQRDLLAEVVHRAEVSDNPDIRELAEDFGVTSWTGGRAGSPRHAHRPR
jgi:hypothetical protein